MKTNHPPETSPPHMLASRVRPDLERARRIVETVCSFYKLPSGDVFGKRRPLSISWARHVSIHFCMLLEPFTMRECAQFIGGGNRTAVAYGLRHVADAISIYPAVARELAQLEKQLRSFGKAKTP